MSFLRLPPSTAFRTLLLTMMATPDSTHGHHQVVNTEIRFIIFFAAKDGEDLYTAKIRPGADCGSDHELLIAKFRIKLKKWGKPIDHSGMT